MPGDEHDRQRFARSGEPALQLEAVQARHRHVEHEAPFRPLIRPCEERLRRLERLDAPAVLPQHARERLQHARIVVDEKDRRRGGRSVMPLPPPASSRKTSFRLPRLLVAVILP